MSSSDWRVPTAVQPKPQDYEYDLDRALASIVGIRSVIPSDALSIGSSSEARVGGRVVVAGAGGRHHSVSARIAARQEFAGYWEYVLDEAIFTAPAHPNWGGTAVIGPHGDLLGIGSLQLEQPREQGNEHLNMSVPIDLLKPIFDDLVSYGTRNRPPRPWRALWNRSA